MANLKKVVQEKIAPIASETDRKGTFRWDVASLFWDLGLLQIMLPEAYGGTVQNPCCTLCLCVEEIAKVCASSALLLVIQAVGSFPLIYAGNEDQKKRFFPCLSRDRKLIAYLVTEPAAGSDVQGVSTSAQPCEQGYLLNGRKVFATNGAVAHLYSVLVKTDEKDLSFFIVERDRVGITIGRSENKCGFRGSNTAEVILEEVSVPRENLLGKEGDGFTIAMADFDMSRPAVAALALGIAQGAAASALDFAINSSGEDEKPLMENQAVQFMLADAATQIEAGRGLMLRAALAFDSERPNTQMSSMAKCFCSDAAMRITIDMVQVLGHYGLTHDHSVERMFRDAKLTQIFEGTNQIQRLIIGRQLAKNKKISSSE